MIGRLRGFVAGSYPPLAVLLAVVWAFGQSSLYAALDPRAHHWRPGGDTVIAAATLVVDLLLMRAVDDVRDLDYDRRHNPGRPLASGAVHKQDLLALCVAGAASLLVLNAWDPAACAILAVQFAYVFAALLIYKRWRRPNADNLLTSLLVSLPVPLLAQVYLYARYLHAEGLHPAREGATAIAIVLLARLHSEFARKTVRNPAAEERTYVHNFGFIGAVSAALTTAGLASILILRLAPWPAALLGLVPLWWALVPTWQLKSGARRWSRKASGYYLLVSFTAFCAIGVLT